jgi:hypothetical protein
MNAGLVRPEPEPSTGEQQDGAYRIERLAKRAYELQVEAVGPNLMLLYPESRTRCRSGFCDSTAAGTPEVVAQAGAGGGEVVGVDGDEPVHVGGVVVAEGEDEDDVGGEGLARRFHAALLGELLDVWHGGTMREGYAPETSMLEFYMTWPFWT